MKPIGLTDAQLMQLQQAAKTLLPSARSEFLQGVARRLGEAPSDGALQAAISEQLAINRIPHFLMSFRTEGSDQMSKHQYFRNGVEISEHEALHRGMLRDQVTMRVRVRDSLSDAAARDARAQAYELCRNRF